MTKKAQLKEAIRPIVKSILREANAYERGADFQFAKTLKQMLGFHEAVMSGR